MNHLEILKKFASGEISFENFVCILNSDDQFQRYLQDQLPCNMKDYASVRWNGGDINKALLEHISKGTKGGKFETQNLIVLWLQGNGFDCTTTPIYKNEYCFLLDVMPDYISGVQAERVVDEIIKNAPENLGNSKRKKIIKEKIKEVFHISGSNYPHWAQDTDWPFSKSGKPLKYVSKKRDGDMSIYTFLDVDTGENIFVEEYF